MARRIPEGGRLSCQRFRQFVRALLFRFEQARILDRDCGLIGEALQSLEFGWRERLKHIAVHDERADGTAAGPDRRAGHGAYARAASDRRAWAESAQLLVEVVEIGQMDLPTFANHRARQVAAADRRT